MQISILDTDGSYLANNGSNAISILGPDGALLPNDGTNYVRITDSTGADKQNDGTVPAYSILGTDGALKPNTGNAVSILNVDGSIATDNMAEFIKSKFAGDAAGAWYDPSDLTTMWTTSSASVQVTATGQTVGWMLDKSKGLARTTKLASVNQFTFNAAGSTPPTTNSATTYLDKDCVSVTFPVLALGGYAVSRGAGNGGAAGWVPVVGEFCRISYEVVFSRPLVGAEQVVVYTTGSSAGAQITFSASVAPIAPTVWTTFSDLAYTDVIGGIGYPVVYAGSSAFDSGLTVYLRAYKVEKVSGNHAYQTTSGYRPVFREVSGVRYLEFDGVDDYLRATFTIAQPIDRISAIQQVTWNSNEHLFGGVTGHNAVLYQTGASPELVLYSGQGGVALTGASSLAIGVTGVVTERHNDAASRAALNNGTYVTGDVDGGLPGGITLGANMSNTGVSNFHLHQLIMRGSTTAMTDAEITLIRNYMREKTGYVPDWRIRALFSANQQGAWYDPSDLSTMFQEAGGYTPVTATGQTVGLILDKRLGLARGAESVTNGDFLAGSAGWTDFSSGTGTAVFATGSVTLSAADASNRGKIQQTITTVVGESYEVFLTIASGTGYVQTFGNDGAAFDRFSMTGAGRYRVQFVATASTTVVQINSYLPGPVVITEYTIKSIAGNHARQSTSGSRPIYRNVAGLQYLEFDGVDDHLRSTFAITTPVDRISAIKQTTWTSGDRIYDGIAGPRGILYQHDVTPKLSLYNSAAVVGPALALAAAGVITERFNGASSRIALNSETYITGDPGAGTIDGITIGAAYTLTSAWGNFNLYQTIMRGGPTALTDEEIYTARKLAGQKSGVLI